MENVIEKTKGMSFVSLDPKKTGEYVLNGSSKKMWIWQNLDYWTNHPGTSYTINGLPDGTYKLEVIGWDGERQTIAISGNTSYTIRDLAVGETYMFLAYTK
ncbi:hypothetical protein D3C75_918770 [compost metagenome]